MAGLSEIAVGSKLPNGTTVGEVVARGDILIVYIDESGSLRHVVDSNAAKINHFREYLMLLFQEVSLDIAQFAPEEHRHSQLSSFGKVFYTAFVSGSDDHLATIQRFNAGNKKICERYARSNFAWAACVLFFIISVVLISFLLLVETAVVRLVILCSVSAGAGATLSICQRVATLEIDWRVSAGIIWREAAFRVFVGLFSGVFLFLCIEGEVALGFVSGNAIAMLAFSMVAGLSERFVPSLVRGLENSAQQEVQPEPRPLPMNADGASKE